MVKFGGPIRSHASFRMSGDSLIPEKITKLLGCKPTLGHKKGDMARTRGGWEYVAHTGSWHLHSEPRNSEDLNGQITEILGRMTADPAVWGILAKEFRMNFFCGLFLRGMNEGLVLSPELLAVLGARGIELSLDIYGPGDEDEDEGPKSSSSHSR
jgi:hypothetical protein